MIRKPLLFPLLILPLALSACGSSASSAPPPTIEGWELVWNDEFGGDTIDESSWTYDIGGWGWGNGEAQYYTDRSDNARLEDGMLVIEAHQERFEDSYYTSARMRSLGQGD